MSVAVVYLQRFYRVAAGLPTHYDPVVNTDQLAPEQTIDVLHAAAR